jgi:hypothetical protein
MHNKITKLFLKSKPHSLVIKGVLVFSQWVFFWYNHVGGGFYGDFHFLYMVRLLYYHRYQNI